MMLIVRLDGLIINVLCAQNALLKYVYTETKNYCVIENYRIINDTAIWLFNVVKNPFRKKSHALNIPVKRKNPLSPNI